MRYTVLSYIFDGYDCVHEVAERDPEADYIMVTDDPALRSETWRIVHDPMPGMTAMERCYDVRFHPFRYAQTELCIRLDASIAILRPLNVFIDKMQDGCYDRCLMVHPFRSRIDDEYRAWVRAHHYPQEQAERCISVMRHLGYNFERRGFFQGCFEVVRRNRINEDINEMTYHLLRYVALDGTIDRIDQTMTSFVVNHLYSNNLRVLPISQNAVTDGRYMRWCAHNSNRFRQWRVKVEPYLFNQPCKPWM